MQEQTTIEIITDEIEELEKFEINPAFYSHIVITQILKAPHMAFINGNEEAGLTSLIFGVDQLERICRANNLIDGNYDSNITTELKKLVEKEGLIRSAKEANIKLQFLLEKIFEHRMKRVDLVL